MGRRPNAKQYSIVVAHDLCCVGEDRVFNPDSEDDADKSLMDELQCPVADEVLIALRKAFSLTFPRNPFMDGIRAEIAEIRRLGVDALKPMPEILLGLGLTPIPMIDNDPVKDKVRVFQFVFAKIEDIDISVTVVGKRRHFLDVAQHEKASSLITTLRSVVSDTFEEAHNEDQLLAVLRRIRERVHAVLPSFNPCLESIEIEPIAEKAADPVDDFTEDGGANERGSGGQTVSKPK
jgi:hypothetical protein